MRQRLESILNEQLSDSIFNPGGTGNVEETNTRRQTVTFGVAPNSDDANYEKKRRENIVRLNDEFQRVNVNLNNIVRARNEAQDEADTIMRELKEENDQLEEAARRLKSNLKKQEQEFRDTCRLIRRQTEELLKERDVQIQQ